MFCNINSASILNESNKFSYEADQQVKFLHLQAEVRAVTAVAIPETAADSHRQL